MDRQLSPDDLVRQAEEALASAARDRDRDVLLLLEFSKAMNSIVDLQPLLDHALSLLVEATGAERGMILMEDPGSRGSELRRLTVLAASLKESPEDVVVSQGIANEVMRTGLPFHSDSLRSDPRVKFMKSVKAQGLAWAVAVPLRHEGRAVGVFYADSKRPTPRLVPSALPFVEALAEHAAIAIERARLLDQNRERERALREVEELKRLGQQKSEFINQLAHELANPLTAIIGYARRLGEGPLDARQQKAARIVLEESERLLQLVNDLLDLARAKAGGAGAAARSFRAREVFSMVKERLPSAEGSQVSGPALEARLQGSRDAFFRVAHNLLGNAFKHGARHAWLTLHPHAPGWVAVVLEDDGPGIAPEQRARAFDEFWRGPGTEATSGHGLGLSIVQSLVQAHGGEIALGDSPRRGASFRLTWPGEIEDA